jgi:hypothetical protein
MWNTKNGIAVSRDPISRPRVAMSRPEAAPRSLFPQVDDQQAEDEGLKKIGSNEAEPALGRRYEGTG